MACCRSRHVSLGLAASHVHHQLTQICPYVQEFNNLVQALLPKNQRMATKEVVMLFNEVLLSVTPCANTSIAGRQKRPLTNAALPV